MSQVGQGNDTETGQAPAAGSGTVWRVTLAWPETSQVGRQERVDGLQQLLSTRAVVGLMGPGRPTRDGMVVDLLLPVSETRILTATRSGALAPGAVGDDFAWELHRFTGAVVVNGDLATGDFAVLASDGTLDDDALARLLDEPVNSALLLGTVASAEVEDVVDRLELGAWISEGERPALAALAPSQDPTALIMPGSADVSLALRERPGRVDVMLWAGSEQEPAAMPTRRRRAARRAPILNTHLGARRRAVVLPAFMRPEGSETAALLERLEEDFAPISGSQAASLGRVLPAVQLNALVAAVNEAKPRGLDPEAGVLAPEEDGLMPGEEPPAPQSPRDGVLSVLSALGEDPRWGELFDGRAPQGQPVRPLGDTDAARAAWEAATREDAQQEPAAAESERRAAAADQATQSMPAVAPAAPPVRTQAEEYPLPSQAGDRAAAARLSTPTRGGSAPVVPEPTEGGFASRLHRAGAEPAVGTFEEVITGVPTGALPLVPAPHGDATPMPTPAAGTPTSSAGDDSAALRAKGWFWPVLIVGVVLLILGAVAFFVADRFGQLAGSVQVGGIAAAVIGLGLGIAALASGRR